MELNVLDLFSGIGGFSVGLEATGKFKTIGFCEQDKFCHKVLHKHWSEVPIYEDIKKLDGTKIKADVLVGGFPCQSFSIAGKQKGKDDERYLWDEMFRVIKEVKPRWIIGENVQNLINISDGQILQGIHNDLESQDFEVQTFNISASSQGAWHKRSRVWIVAANTNSRLSIGENEEVQARGNTFDNGSSADVSDTDSRLRRRRGTELKSGENEVREFHFKEEEQSEQHIRSKAVGHNAVFGKTKNVTNSKLKGLERRLWNSSRGKWEILQEIKNDRRKMGSSIRCSDGKNKTWWQTQSELCGVPDGVQYELYPDRANRIKALGNSIVPQIVTEIGKAIIKAEEEIDGTR